MIRMHSLRGKKMAAIKSTNYMIKMHVMRDNKMMVFFFKELTNSGTIRTERHVKWSREMLLKSRLGFELKSGHPPQDDVVIFWSY